MNISRLECCGILEIDGIQNNSYTRDFNNLLEELQEELVYHEFYCEDRHLIYGGVLLFTAQSEYTENANALAAWLSEELDSPVSSVQFHNGNSGNDVVMYTCVFDNEKLSDFVRDWRRPVPEPVAPSDESSEVESPNQFVVGDAVIHNTYGGGIVITKRDSHRTTLGVRFLSPTANMHNLGGVLPDNSGMWVTPDRCVEYQETSHQINSQQAS